MTTRGFHRFAVIISGEHICRFLLVASLCGGCSAGSDVAEQDKILPLSEHHAAGSTVLGLAFPPVKDLAELEFTAGHLDALNVKMIRIGESWKWRELQRGRYNWSPLDARMKFFQERKLSVLVTIQADGPDWAVTETRNDLSGIYRNERDFDGYVSSLLQRYSNQIDKIQYGNEWEWKEWYVGTADDFIRANNILYAAVKRHSPRTRVVLGGISTAGLSWLAAVKGRAVHVVDEGREISGTALVKWRESVIKRGWLDRVERVISRADYDLLDVHLYDDPENWGAYLEVLRALCPNRQILVSEFGGPNPLVAKPDQGNYQADCLRAYIHTLRNLGIEEAYFFTLSPHIGAKYFHRNSSLLDESLKRKPAYDVFLSFSRRQE